MAAFSADAVDLHPVPAMLKALFVREHRKHPFQPFVSELDNPAAPFADQVLVVGLRCHWLVTLEALPKLVRPHQTALDQQIQSAIHRSGAYGLTLLFELPLDPVDRQVVLGPKYDLGNEIALAGDRLVVLPEVTAESIEKGCSLGLIEMGHQRGY